jgi:drug/metabolite transporter (DMT)-like permease
MKIAGILLILAGVAALVYGGFSYTSQEKAVDMGPIQISRTEHHSIPVSPILGIVAIAGGAALIYSGAKSRG